MSPDLAFNTAVSFVTNTSWQAYSGEAQLSYLSQMAGLTVQIFVSAATGMAVAVAIVRGFTGTKGSSLGNFRVDMTRSVLYILLPMSILLAIFLALNGVPQTLLGAVQTTTVEGLNQTIARGPAAAQIANKQLGTNGGGFFGVNSAHPFENPTIASNMAQTLSIPLIPVASRKEFDLLWLLMSQSGRLLPQTMILKAIWGPAHVEDSQYLRVYIRQLRAKIGDDATDPQYIFTEAGVGSRFRPD